jgi:DNA topoisomerase-2
MHLYTSKGTIAKYDTVEEILKEFYLIRYAFYVKRKIYILKKLKRELNIYESKIRFIREFIDGKINIMNKEDAEVEQILQENDYPKFSTEENDIKNEKPEASNESENENENEFGSYDYLLNMKMRTLTKNRIQELEKLYEEKSAYSKMLEEKSEKDIWKEELEEFRKCYLKNLDEYNELYEEERNRFETKKKAAPKKKNTKK